MKPIVAIIGRPNVGKSTLFNRLIGRRLAIVEDEPGVTRDRLYADADWNGRTFTLVDTGGVLARPSDEVEVRVREQALAAIAESDLVLFVVDIRAGVTPDDLDVADLLRRSQKPVLLVANKADHIKIEDARFEFFRLGLGEPLAISALHGTSSGELLDAVVHLLPQGLVEDEDEGVLRLAVVGRPNVGKSSLVNAIAGQDRVIVSERAGTTRDAIDVVVRHPDFETPVVLVDTAGVRRRTRVEEAVERASVMRALRAVDRADVVAVLIEAKEGVTEQDSRIVGYAHEAGKASMLVVNKWDLVEKDDKTARRFEEAIRRELPFLDYAPVLFVSALTGQRVTRVVPLAFDLWAEARKRVQTSELNELLSEAFTLVPPPSDAGRRLKLFYATQAGVTPPSFVLFVNDPELAHFSYQRYLENRIRQRYGFRGTPIRIKFRSRRAPKDP